VERQGQVNEDWYKRSSSNVYSIFYGCHNLSLQKSNYQTIYYWKTEINYLFGVLKILNNSVLSTQNE